MALWDGNKHMLTIQYIEGLDHIYPSEKKPGLMVKIIGQNRYFKVNGYRMWEEVDGDGNFLGKKSKRMGKSQPISLK